MKGFIEVTGDIDKGKHVVNVAHIIDFFYSKEQECAAIIMSNSVDGKALGVRETCSKLKALIEAAQEEDGETVAVELVKIVGEKNEREHMIDNYCDFCEGGAIRFALKRGGHADDWFDYTRQLTVGDGAINIEIQNELSTEVENIIFEGISHCPFCGKTFQENTEEIE